MKRETIRIGGIPAVVWGEKSDRVYLFVHGKMSSKEAAESLAELADGMGYQTVSFDLPGHGERQEAGEACDIWNGMRDLKIVGEYVFSRWQEVSLYACSLGAYFSLNAYAEYPFRRCLFQSPIVDMDALIHRMMYWFSIDEERLEREGEIDTPVDRMSWRYYRYVREHPITDWPIPTRILYAGRDNMQSPDDISEFAGKFGCMVTVSAESEHPFMAEGDRPIVEKWLRDNL